MQAPRCYPVVKFHTVLRRTSRDQALPSSWQSSRTRVLCVRGTQSKPRNFASLCKHFAVILQSNFTLCSDERAATKHYRRLGSHPERAFSACEGPRVNRAISHPYASTSLSFAGANL